LHVEGGWSGLAFLALLVAIVGCASGGGPAASPEAGAGVDGAGLQAVPAPSDPSGTGTLPLVAEALEACESAQVLWQQGDLEGAMANLDAAYELLLQIPDEPGLMQQKDDLRHLISRRVVEMYRSRLATAGELSSSIPVEINQHVEREIARFTGPERQFFLASYRRSGRYRPMIVRKLREAGLPEELSWLPLVESGFKVRALSRARALGMWQFISSTGTRYGLDRSRWIDERMDPEKSTDAATDYLTNLHGMFGDWLTALASYNCGENRVMRLIRRQENEHLDRFWDLYPGLPSETARYVPRFLATLAIVADPEKYGIELPEPEPALDLETLTVDRHLRLKDVDEVLELEPGTIVGLNPELRHATTPAQSYALRVPSDVAATFEAELADMPAYRPPPELTFARHRVRRGETLSTIARRYRTTVTKIVRANHLRSSHRIRAGQILKIPQRGSTGAVTASRGVGNQRLTHTVRRGDTIGRIAAARNVSADRLLRVNGLTRSSTIYPGQVIRLPN
jgi:membrane-bound lytic murein transglycosylase D